MIHSIVKNEITFYSVDDLNKILKEPSSVMVADRTIKANSLKEGKDYIRPESSDYYFTRKAMGRLCQPYEKKLNGMMAIRALKELSAESRGEVVAEASASLPFVPYKDKKQQTLDKPKPDYSKRLTNISSYHITHHAEKRIYNRFDVPAGKKQNDWFTGIAPRLGYMGTQFGNTQEVWGNDEVTIITSPTEKSVITVLEPDMDVNVSDAHYDDIDMEFSQAIHKLSLRENRSYWGALATQFQELQNFAGQAYASIEAGRTATNEADLADMDKQAQEIVATYHKLTYDLESLIQDHVERLKYIESKR